MSFGPPILHVYFSSHHGFGSKEESSGDDAAEESVATAATVVDRGRGRAMGLMSVGPPLGSGIFAAFAGWLLLTTEWRDVFQLFAAIAGVVVVPLIVLIVPRHFDDVPAASDSSADTGLAIELAAKSGEVASAGQSMADVVRVNYYLPDRAEFEPCWPILAETFGATPPAATMIECGLIDDKYRIEIEVTACIPTA